MLSEQEPRWAPAWLLGLAVGCAGPSAQMVSEAPHTQAPQEETEAARCSDLSALSWLVGTWASTVDGVRVEEQWVQPDASLLLGTNRVERPGQAAAVEHLQLECVQGEARYSAWPSTQAPATFRLVRLGDSEAVFSNPAHDFPRRIIYRRSATALTARIEGGAGTPAQWRWERVPDPPPAPAPLKASVAVQATPAQVWEALTTVEGVAGFFAPRARIDPRPGGAYEMLFMLDAAPGSQGGEGCTFIRLEAPRRLAFTWNFPPHLASLRTAHTLMLVSLRPAAKPGVTQVAVEQRGWRHGPGWAEGRAYFERAWGLVLQRLQRRFEQGPIDWSAL